MQNFAKNNQSYSSAYSDTNLCELAKTYGKKNAIA